MRKTMGGALLLATASAMCTTNTASANCNSVLVYDNGFPNICIVVPSQVNDSTGASPAGADDVVVPASGMRVNDIHWYAVEPTATGIDYSGNAQVIIWQALGGCAGPNKGVVAVQNITTPTMRTVVNPGGVSVGGVIHDVVRYDMTKIDFGLPGGVSYWVTLRPVSNSNPAPGDSLWMSTRCEQNGDVIQGCAAWADPDTGAAGGWAEIGTAGTSNIDLNFQFTRCEDVGCPWNLNGDNTINTADLFILLADIQTQNLRSDLNNDNVVNTADLFILLAHFGWLCPPNGTNDDCSFATLISGVGNTAVNLAGATNSGPADGCAGVSDGTPDVWYCWKAECTGFTTVTLDFAAGLRVYAGGTQDCGDCGNLGAPIACGPNSARFLAEEGHHYRIRVSGSGNGTMNIGDCEPFNDECVDAIIISTPDGPVDGTLIGYNGDTVPPCPAVDPNPPTLGQAPGVWYVCIGTGNQMTATTCLNNGIGENMRIAVYCGNSCDGFQSTCTLLNGADLPCGFGAGTQANSSWCSVQGVIYFLYLTMDNNVDPPGPYQIQLLDSGASCVPTSFEAGCPGIPGDVCAIDQDTNRGIGSGANCQLPDQAGHGADGIVGATSDRNPGAGFTVADDFAVSTSGNLTSICWWGFYLNFNIPADCAPGDAGGNGDHFRIRILDHNPALGLPGTTEIVNVPDFTPALNSQKRYTGNTIGSGAGPLEEWEYTYTFQSPVALTAGTCYWLEISNNTLADCFWLWSTAGPGNGRSAQDTDLNGYAAGECNDWDQTFCLSLDLGDVAAVCGEGCACFDPVLCTLNGYYQCPAFGTAFTSDPSIGSPPSNLLAADNFVAQGSSLTACCWWGVYLTFSGGFSGCSSPPPAGATFNITIYNDSAHLPSSVVASRTGVVPTRMAAGPSIISPTYEFSASFAPIALTPGNTYWIAIQLNPNQQCEFLWVDSSIGDNFHALDVDSGGFGLSDNDLAFRLDIAGDVPAPPSAPANDDCANAIPITDGTTAFSTVGATTDGPDNGASNPCNDFGSTQTNEDIWFEYTATCTGTLRVSTCEDYGGSANYDTDLVIYQATPANCPLTDNSLRIACNDDDAAAACGVNSFHSKIDVAVTAGTHYLIRVGGWGPGDQGTGNLFIQCTP